MPRRSSMTIPPELQAVLDAIRRLHRVIPEVDTLTTRRVLDLMDVPGVGPCRSTPTPIWQLFRQAYASLGISQGCQDVLALTRDVRHEGIAQLRREWEEMDAEYRREYHRFENRWRVCLPNALRRRLAHDPHALGVAIRITRTQHYNDTVDIAYADFARLLRPVPRHSRPPPSIQSEISHLEQGMNDAVEQQAQAHLAWRRAGSPTECPPLAVTYLRWKTHASVQASVSETLSVGVERVIENEVNAVELQIEIRNTTPEQLMASCPPTYLALVVASATVATYRAVLQEAARQTGYRSPWID